MSCQALTVRGAVADVLVALADRVRRGANAAPAAPARATTDTGPVVNQNGIRTLCILPEQGLMLHAIEVCKYLDKDGDEAFCVRTSGTTSRSDFVGTIEAGKLIGLDLWPPS